jgi:hypothetical protein
MKTQSLSTNILVLTALLAAGCSKASSQAADSSQISRSQANNSTTSSSKPPEEEEVIPAGSVKLAGVDLPRFLGVYSHCAKAQIDTSLLGTRPPAVLIHFENTNAVTLSEMVQLF